MKKENKKTSFKKYILWFWGIVLGGFSLIVLFIFITSIGGFGALPTFEELENPQTNIATEVISTDGKTIGKYAVENRTPIQYKELPKNIVDALVATEDVRYYEHSGIDFKGLARAISKLGTDGGASTITQQLAKNLFNDGGSSNKLERLLQKVKEWIVAVKLERQYTKQEIIAMYLNTQDFVFNAVGIRSAARIYFDKEAKDLDVQEAAIIVAMLKNPVLYNPHIKRFKKNSHKRRNVVLSQMAKNGVLSGKEKDSLQKLPLKINYTPESHDEGYATYFRTHLQKELKKWVKKHPKPNGEYYDIFRDGLKIFTTIDSRMQQYAEESVIEHMSNLQTFFFKEQKRNKTAPFYDIEREEINKILVRAKKNSERYKRLKKTGKNKKYIDKVFKTKTKMRVFSWKGKIDTIMSPNDSIFYYKHFLRSGLVSIEPQSGHIKAWVGGINNKFFKYDAVAQQKRQVGSTFKPFVYATAINQLRMSPCDELPNIPYTIPKGKYGLMEDWTPKNSSEKYGGMLSLKDALASSVNVVTANLMDKVSPQNVVNLAKSAGIETRLNPYPSLALGTIDLSLLEMTSAYSTFANKGLRVSPMIITRIEDKNGTVLDEFTPNTKEVLSEESAYVILDLLQGVTQSGSGARLRSKGTSIPEIVTGFPYEFDNAIAGKTGTTQNQSDGWFMGIVPNLATGVWTGGEDRATHFAGITKGQGATMSLPSWALFMQKCYADKTLNISTEDFEEPETLTININCGNEPKLDEDPENKKPKPIVIEDDVDF